MQATMMDVPLSLNHFLDRAGTLFKHNRIVSRLPDKSLRTMSYGQWHRRTRALGSALQRLGLRPGDRVATLGWNHHAHLEAYFGIPAAGGVMHTLNLRLSPDELGWIAADAQDRFLIVDDVLLPLYRQFAHLHAFEQVIVFPFSGAPVPAEFADYEALLAEADPDGFVYAEHGENDPVAMCYTSGTTGRPKGVVYSHRSTVLHTLAASLADHWGLRSSDVVLPVTPMFHANSWGMPYGAVMLGVPLVFPGPHLHPEDLLDLMQLEPPTLALGVPTIWLGLIQAYERALETTPGRWRLPQGMRSLVGGAAVPESLIRAFARHGVIIVQGWGMTETSPLATVSYPRAELRDAGEDERFRRAAMAGIAAPLIELRLVTDEGRVAPWDGQTMGEIQVRGPFITGSYHGVPRSEDKFIGDDRGQLWLRTGDVATLDDLGFLRITDRTKDLIKSGGEWISSVDLENALMAHPAVAEAAVIAIADEKWGERPLACVAFKPGQNAAPDALNAHLLQHGFAKWQLPDRYQTIDAVPRTSTGKFSKLKLRQMFPR
ncbi:long-chain fatty acid--CoA ligase [Aquincola sp. S2]|uniref:Long-chain fatty acid--CoA ligase n=1 Tax=Pseudaquabacterium terrae TaxID=2732868 RepID=A0ABX2EN94_9BURK|nr:long-chain fatty acid--CoA ligase [Aquabacterium terrae]NRF70042.1 long-chain fatty acid--CoA ligase [Aquabacterium terrae]